MQRHAAGELDMEIAKSFDAGIGSIKYWKQKHGIRTMPSRHTNCTDEEIISAYQSGHNPSWIKRNLHAGYGRIKRILEGAKRDESHD